MVLFSTLLNFRETMTPDAFLSLVFQWNEENGSSYSENHIPDIEWDGSHSFRYATERLCLEAQEYDDIIAVRFEKLAETGAVWNTDYIANFRERRIAVRLERSFSEEALNPDPTFSTPHFLSLLIREDYLCEDGPLPVLREPITVTDETLPLLAEVINGTAEYDLPVVYVSKTSENEDPLDVALLASRLKGAAHVLVENNLLQNEDLMQLTDRKNEFYGAVGVYFPNNARTHRRFLNRGALQNSKLLLENTVTAVIRFMLSRITDNMYTRQGVKNAVILRQMEKSREEMRRAQAAAKRAEENAEYALEWFCEDSDKLEQQIKDLTKENMALQAENEGLRRKYSSVDTVPVLFLGNENEFFTDEIKCFLLEELEKAQNNIPGDTRRADVIKDIIESNAGEALLENRRQELRAMLTGFNGVSATLRRGMENLGYRFESDNRHYKLYYYGDGRYRSTLACTPSDVRAGRNALSEIINKTL